jgi:hypothetical protein
VDFPLLDAMEIARNRARWHPVGRSEALRACARSPVAVLSRLAGQDAASWLLPASRYFGSDGPFRYDNLRYYVYTGAEFGKLKGRTRPPEGEEFDLEPMEVVGDSGEPISLSSPIKKPKPKLPIEFHLVDAAGKPMAGVDYEVILPDGTSRTGKSDAEGFIKFPDNIHPGEARLKLFPKQANAPADAGVSGKGPAGPETDLAAGIPFDKPAGIPKPVQILLVDEAGVPMPNTSYQIRWPDGKVESGKSDRTGLISYPKNTQSGDLVLTVADIPPPPETSKAAGGRP